MGERNHIRHDAEFIAGAFISVLGKEERELEYLQAREAPKIVTAAVRPLRIGGKIASDTGAARVQFKALPPIIAPNLRASIGIAM